MKPTLLPILIAALSILAGCSQGGGGTGGDAGSTTPVDNTPVQLAFHVQPPNGKTGKLLAPAVEVELLNAQGNRVPSSELISLTLETGTSGATLSGTLSKPATFGVVVFNDLSVDLPGVGYTLRANGAGLTTVSDPFHIKRKRFGDDFNSDGRDDWIMGAPGNSQNGGNAGSAYIFLTGSGVQSASAADHVIRGQTGNRVGNSVNFVGDVNADGFDDALVCARGLGQAWLFYGNNNPPGLGALTPNVVVHLPGSGTSSEACKAGDLNGDGYADFAVSYNPGGSGAIGQVYVFFGGAALAKTLDYTQADVSLQGEAALDKFGWSLDGAGDVNGDGYDDLLVSAHLNDAGKLQAGECYIFYGGPGFSGSFDGSQADVTFTGEQDLDDLGSTVAGLGDVNGDGYDDVVLGSELSDRGATLAGASYVFLGGPALPATVSAASADLIIEGEFAYDRFAYSVSGVGDFNADGYDDIAVGAGLADPTANACGRVYLFFGNAQLGGLLNAGQADAMFDGELQNDKFSIVRSVGDVNNDGFDDLVGQALLGDRAGFVDAGACHLFHGESLPLQTRGAGNADRIAEGEWAYNYLGLDRR